MYKVGSPCKNKELTRGMFVRAWSIRDSEAERHRPRGEPQKAGSLRDELKR